MRAPSGMRLPARATTPTAKAMSVATGMPQPREPAPPALTSGEDEGRDHHAAQRGERRERRGAGVAQLAEEQLALDLQAGQQEEQGHRGVVDPAPQGEVEIDEVAQPDLQLRRPQRLVAGPQTGVGPDQGGDGRDQHDDARRRLDPHEAQGRLDERSGDEAIGVAPRRPQEVGRRPVGSATPTGNSSPHGTVNRAGHSSHAVHNSDRRCRPAGDGDGDDLHEHLDLAVGHLDDRGQRGVEQAVQEPEVAGLRVLLVGRRRGPDVGVVAGVGQLPAARRPSRSWPPRGAGACSAPGPAPGRGPARR